jgi:hypothetical protein
VVHRRRACSLGAAPLPGAGWSLPEKGTVVDAAINQIFSHLLQTGTTIAAVVCAFWVMWAGFQVRCVIGG